MGALHRFHGDDEVREIIERIENAEDIDAFSGGMLDETFHHVVGIVRVTDGVGTAEQHLETDVGYFCAKLTEAFPWIFMEKTHRGVEGGAAPHFHAEKLRGTACDRVRHRE